MPSHLDSPHNSGLLGMMEHESTVLARPGEEDVNRNKVGYALTGLDGDRGIKLKAPAADGDGANQAVNGQLLKLERRSRK